MTPNGDVNGRYYVNETYTFECNFGYEKVLTDIIQCGTDGKWTASPNCTKRGRSACASCYLVSTSISANYTIVPFADQQLYTSTVTVHNCKDYLEDLFFHSPLPFIIVCYCIH